MDLYQLKRMDFFKKNINFTQSTGLKIWAQKNFNKYYFQAQFFLKKTFILRNRRYN